MNPRTSESRRRVSSDLTTVAPHAAVKRSYGAATNRGYIKLSSNEGIRERQAISPYEAMYIASPHSTKIVEGVHDCMTFLP
jgi:hypothetical protein